MTEPIAAYNYEGAGIIQDVTGNGHDWALPAGLTRQPGLDGTALRHESTAANSGGPAIFGQTAQRSLVLDIIRTSNSVDGWVAEMKNGTADTGVWGFLLTGGNVQARAKNAANSPTFASFAQPTINVRHQLAMTYDGTNIRLYIDAVLRATAAFAGPIWTAATHFHMMDTVSSETMIDNLRVYDVALSQPEIAALVGVPVTAPPPPATGRLKYESAPGVWTPIPLKTQAGVPLAIKTETSPGTWEALP